MVTPTTIASLIPLGVGTSATTLSDASALATAGGTVAGPLGAMLILPALLARVPRAPQAQEALGEPPRASRNTDIDEP